MKFKFFLNLVLLLVSISLTGQQSTIKPDQSGLASVNGVKIYYQVYGKGDPVVLLHGSFMTIEMNWSELIPELAKTRKVIAVEMQGHGRSPLNDRTLSYTNFASDVAGVLKHLKIEKADVIGYSLGGTIGLEFVIKHPEMVKNLVVISSVFKDKGWVPSVSQALASFQPEFFDQTPLYTGYKSVAPEPDHWRKFLSQMIAFENRPYDLGADNIKAIESPVLLIMGDNDGVSLGHVAEMYSLLGGNVSADMEGLPKSQLAIIPGMSHVGLMMETEKIVSIISPFLAGKVQDKSQIR